MRDEDASKDLENLKKIIPFHIWARMFRRELVTKLVRRRSITIEGNKSLYFMFFFKHNYFDRDQINVCPFFVIPHIIL